MHISDAYMNGNDFFDLRFRLDAGFSWGFGDVWGMFGGCFGRRGYGLFGLIVRIFAFLIVR